MRALQSAREYKIIENENFNVCKVDYHFNHCDWIRIEENIDTPPPSIKTQKMMFLRLN